MNERLQNLINSRASGIVEEHALRSRLDEILKQRALQEGAIMALQALIDESAKAKPDPVVE